MVTTTETELVRLVAYDRFDIPISSMSGKLYREKRNIAKGLGLEAGEEFQGERVYGRVEQSEQMKARGMREGIEAYCAAYPQQGKILQGMIEQERVAKETHLHFGLNEGRRMDVSTYMSVLDDLGFTTAQAMELYPALMSASRRISEKRGNPERSIMIG